MRNRTAVSEIFKVSDGTRRPFPVRPVFLRKPDLRQFKLPPYSPESACSACGFEMVTTEYVPQAVGPFGNYEWPWAKMKRQCANCQKVWFEEPLDVPDDRYGAVVKFRTDQEWNARIRSYTSF